MASDVERDESVRFRAAKERVEQLRGFYIHLAVFLMINVMIFAVNMAVDRHNLWFYWSLLGWGIGLAAHAMSVFVLTGRLGKNWEERKITELMDKDRDR